MPLQASDVFLCSEHWSRRQARGQEGRAFLFFCRQALAQRSVCGESKQLFPPSSLTGMMRSKLLTLYRQADVGPDPGLRARQVLLQQTDRQNQTWLFQVLITFLQRLGPSASVSGIG